MNWLSFLAWLGLAYFLYYLALIVSDSRSPGNTTEELPVLTFSEDHQPEKVLLEDVLPAANSVLAAPAVFEPATKGLGAVSLAKLFELSRNEAIEYTRAVSF